MWMKLSKCTKNCTNGMRLLLWPMLRYGGGEGGARLSEWGYAGWGREKHHQIMRTDVFEVRSVDD